MQLKGGKMLTYESKDRSQNINELKKRIKCEFKSYKRPRKNSIIPTKLKDLACDGVAAGMTLKEIAKIANISPSAIFTWNKRKLNRPKLIDPKIKILPVTQNLSEEKEKTSIFLLRIGKFNIELFTSLGV
jgi:LysM repeat protein